LKRFAYIDALRGYAILGVILVHTSQKSGFDSQGAFGARGVQLFFLASALTLMFSWHERHDGATAFFVRRIFRIVPMFWVSIPIYLALHVDADTTQVLSAALFLQAIRPDWIEAPIVPGGWSVCAEMLFYCMFPLIGIYVNSFLKACALAVAWFALARLWALYGSAFGAAIFPTFNAPEIGIWVFLSLPSQLPPFAVGILLYFVIPRWKHAVGRAATEMLLAAALILIAYLAAYRSPAISYFSLAFGLVALCLANGAGRYLINAVITRIGRLSFSIYLLHWLCIGRIVSLIDVMQIGAGARFFLLFCGTTALTTALAAITYSAIERPMIRLGNRLIERILVPSSESQPAQLASAPSQLPSDGPQVPDTVLLK
jgi:peptidoglycan/LPS O-acetylase OafA/YrhL